MKSNEDSSLKSDEDVLFPDSKQSPEVEIRTRPKSLWGSVRRDPLPFAGALITVGILGTGFYAFLKGKTRMSQNMMRARIAAQTITIGLVLFSAGYKKSKKK